jgi:hypothetical protein
MPGESQLVREQDAEQFAEEIEQEFQSHVLETEE